MTEDIHWHENPYKLSFSYLALLNFVSTPQTKVHSCYLSQRPFLHWFSAAVWNSEDSRFCEPAFTSNPPQKNNQTQIELHLFLIITVCYWLLMGFVVSLIFFFKHKKTHTPLQATAINTILSFRRQYPVWGRSGWGTIMNTEIHTDRSGLFCLRFNTLLDRTAWLYIQDRTHVSLEAIFDI